nr:MarR family transcriptional regulator [Microbacterium lemovicicum]
MTERSTPQSLHDLAVREVLEEVRAFTDAIDRMHSDMKGDMEMNATDLAALRMLIMRESRGEVVSPHDLARHLRITTASTTKMLDRLSRAGHLDRRPHPHDGRSRVVVLTDLSRQAFFRNFGHSLAKMRAVADRYSDEELRVIGRFLEELGRAVSSDEPAASSTRRKD